MAECSFGSTRVHLRQRSLCHHHRFLPHLLLVLLSPPPPLLLTRPRPPALPTSAATGGFVSWLCEETSLGRLLAQPSHGFFLCCMSYFAFSRQAPLAGWQQQGNGGRLCWFLAANWQVVPLLGVKFGWTACTRRLLYLTLKLWWTAHRFFVRGGQPG